MVNCGKCGKHIGFTEIKYDYIDDDGNPVKYCSQCNDNFEKKEKIRTKELLKKNIIWEYRVLNIETKGSRLNATGNKVPDSAEKQLNELGQDGWELISVVPMNSIAPRLGVSGTATEYVSCFLRRKL